MPPPPTRASDSGVDRSGWPDRQLVDMVLSGDDEAFRILVDREMRQVTGICRRILGDAAEAEDVVQEAFLAAYRALGTYRGDGPFAAWIYRIAARQAVARIADRPTGPLLDDVAGAIASSSVDGDPEAVALVAEQRVAIRDAIASLPPSQRDVVAMRFLEERSIEEIARTTRTPVGTVKSRLHRGLANLRAGMPTGRNG